MPARNIIVIGASTGGIEALMLLAKALPPDLRAAVFVVVHVAPDGPALLAEILDRAGALAVSYARDGDAFEHGHIYVAPPDHHMLLEAPDRMRVTRGPKENRFRPAIDPLFRSATLAFGPRVAGVILTGNLDDGTVGLAAIKRRDGIAIVQDPAEASAPSMPLSALRRVKVDHNLGVAQMGPLLATLANPASQSEAMPIKTTPMTDELRFEVDLATRSEDGDASAILKLGDPSLFTCPDCHGALVELREEGPLRFRCHTGHAFTAASLVAALSDSVEDALWTTLRGLQEKVMLLRHMASHSSESLEAGEVEKLLHEARKIHKRSQLVRQALLQNDAG